MAESRRKEKVDLLVQEEIAAILNREIEFPAGIIATITRVTASTDLYYADVFISVFPKKEKVLMKILEKATPHIQALLNKKLRMRPVPRIRFRIDETEKVRENIERLLSAQ